MTLFTVTPPTRVVREQLRMEKQYFGDMVWAEWGWMRREFAKDLLTLGFIGAGRSRKCDSYDSKKIHYLNSIYMSSNDHIMLYMTYLLFHLLLIGSSR